MPGRIDFEFSPRGAGKRRAGEEPLRILVLADLTGRRWREAARLQGPTKLDFDRFDAALSASCGEIQLDGGSFRPTELDHFRPEHLLKELAIFARLRDLRARLTDSRTFESAAAELGRVKPASPAAPAREEEDDDSIEAILAREAESRRREIRDLDAYLESLVAPYVVPQTAPDQAQWIATVDRSLAEAMRQVLQDPLLRHFETTWRGLEQLVSELELGESIELETYDVTLEDLHSDFSAATSPEATELHRNLVAARPDGWGVWLADFEFDLDPLSIGVLPTLGVISAQAGAPIVAGAAPSLVGASNFSDAPEPRAWQERAAQLAETNPLSSFWHEIRRTSVAPWIALVAPRILARLPYGKSTDPVEAFDFEEYEAEGDPEALLWGNPAYAVVQLLAEAFQEKGWNMTPGDVDLVSIPVFTTFREDGELQLNCSAETFLTDAAVDAMEKAGIMSAIADRSSNVVRFRHFHSIADPLQGLSGGWR